MTARRALVALLLALGIGFAAPSSAQESVIVVRHAERADSSADAALSPAGEQRAIRLAGLLKDTKLAAIFVSPLRRTAQTARPTANAQRITPVAFKNEELDKLAAAIRAVGTTGHVLVVGHSNTIPEILKRLGVAEPVAVADEDFGNLFLVIPQPDSVPQLVRLRY